MREIELPPMSKGRKLSGEQIIRLLHLYAAGNKYEFIQSLMSVSWSTIHRHAKEHGLVHPNAARAGQPRNS